ncbi:MAG: FAD:protein FMN transferase [Bacteroidales bacterium]|nr:FAD:protein FMN transferase [Bacteroidales bacterium]
MITFKIRFIYPALWVLIILLFLVSPAFAQLLDNETEAFIRAKEQNRPVFLIFSGSDWCVPCIRFEKEIFSDSSFIKYSEENLVILKAEFPQKKKLSPEIILQNEKLAEKYNPTGLFPHLVLLNPDGNIITTLWYEHQSTEEFIRQMKNAMPETDCLKEFRTSAMLMGCGFEFTIVDSANSNNGWQLIQESINEVKRIENMISEWSDTTEAGRLNANAGKEPVRLSPEVYELIRRSIIISELTQGAFDITFGGVGKLWRFDRKNPVMPDSSTVMQALGSVGYRHILLMDSSQVFLSKPGMRIGFGAIGKGYAAEIVKTMLMKKGITSGVVNASGDLTAWGIRPDGSSWKVGIADPTNPVKILLWLPVTDAAVATSGDYEKYFEINGIRYAHIIDPRTGYPTKGVQSVTIISPDAELSDALATAVFVMGVETGLDFIAQLPGTYCIIIDDKNNIHYSRGIELLITKE